MNAHNLKPWKPGQSGNPSGLKKLPEALRGIQSLTQIEVCKLISLYARKTREQLQSSLQDPKVPMIEITIASIFAQSAKNGDYTRLSFLLDRAIGKTQLLAEEDNELSSLTDQELLRLLKEKIPELKAG